VLFNSNSDIHYSSKVHCPGTPQRLAFSANVTTSCLSLVNFDTPNVNFVRRRMRRRRERRRRRRRRRRRKRRRRRRRRRKMSII
jgi:hypothetical protein